MSSAPEDGPEDGPDPLAGCMCVLGNDASGARLPGQPGILGGDELPAIPAPRVDFQKPELKVDMLSALLSLQRTDTGHESGLPNDPRLRSLSCTRVRRTPPSV